jgi:putative flippase GtrA
MFHNFNISMNNSFIRYVVGGVISFVIEYLLFLLLFYIVSFHENIAHSISYVIAIIINFSILKWWVFKSGDKVFKQSIYYLILVGFNFLLSNLLILILLIINIPGYQAKITTMAIIILWNYIIMKRFIFMGNR